MGNLIDIQSQIEKLQKQAADIRSREFHTTVQDILAKMAAFGITVKDLEAARKTGPKGRGAGKAKAAGGARAAKKGAAKSAVAPKFRGPNGETWTGRGLMPRWLSALVSSGRSKDEFAIKA
ncbi:MAG: H-NS family nucleoid-associated regulatory protein [Betaproteobacteria bacterium]